MTQCLDLSKITQFWYMISSVVCGSNLASSVLGIGLVGSGNIGSVHMT